MIVDFSALIALFRREPEWSTVLDKIRSSSAAVGAPTLVETGMVLTALTGPAAGSKLARMVQELRISIVAFQPAHWQLAVEAFDRFGKGRHPARLNFGDCLSYAVAKHAGQPLLALGADFSKTDLDLA